MTPNERWVTLGPNEIAVRYAKMRKLSTVSSPFLSTTIFSPTLVFAGPFVGRLCWASARQENVKHYFPSLGRGPSLIT